MSPVRPCSIPRLTLLVLLLFGICGAQSLQRSIVFTSTEPYVILAKGALITLHLTSLSVPPADGNRAASPGQLVQATLEQELNGKKAKVGDPVSLKVVYPFRFDSEGKSTQVPGGTAIVGHVLLAAKRDRKTGKSQLGIALDTLTLAEEPVTLNASVVAAQPPAANAPVTPSPHVFLAPVAPPANNSKTVWTRHQNGTVRRN